METGTVAAVKPEKGFGFIKRDNGQGDVFFHVHNTDDRLPFEETLLHLRVRFDVEESERGPRAINVCAAD